MSNEALTWAFSHQIKSGPKFVLVALADYADEEHSCYPSIEKLHQKTGIAKKTISTHLSALDKLGFFTRERRRYNDGNLGSYRFTLGVGKDVKIKGTDLEITLGKSRGKSFENSPHANLATGSPHANLGKTTPLNLHDNNHHTNHHTITTSERPDKAISKAMGNAANPRAHRMYVMMEPLSWTQGENACDFDLDLIPTIKRLSEAAPPQSISSWNYYKRAVFEHRDLRISKPNNPEPKKGATHAKRSYTTSEERGITKSEKLDRIAEAALRITL